MIIEYSLIGSIDNHKGVFDTEGFWVKCGVDRDDITKEVTTYKIWSHFSFTYESKDKDKANSVYQGLIQVLQGANWYRDGIGEIRIIRR